MKNNINYHIGSHGCDPVGPVKYSETTEIKHLHYKWISHKYMTRRSAGVADRLSDWNLSGGCGSHNRPFSLTSINDFNKRYDFQSVQIIGEENKITRNDQRSRLCGLSCRRHRLFKVFFSQWKPSGKFMGMGLY